MDPTLAEIRIFAGNFAPLSWAFCNGALMSIAENTALFSLLGTTYGGDGQTTFALPDMRGRVPVGVGQGAGLSYYDLGQVSGSPTVTLISTQMPAHTHQMVVSGAPTLNVSSGQATNAAASGTNSSIASPGTMSGRTFNASLGFNTSAPDVAINSVNMHTMSVNNSIAGGSQPHDNMMPYMGINYIIAVEGIYPSRN